MQCSYRFLSVLGLVVLALFAGAIQADPEAHPELLDYPTAIETQTLGELK